MPRGSLKARRNRVYVRAPRPRDAAAFLSAVRASRELHRGWVKPPSTRAAYAAMVARYAPSRRASAPLRHCGLLVVRREDDAIAGVINVSEIVRGSFQSAYLGYYAFAPHTGRGYMHEGLELVLAWVFRTLKLHRVEANIQPENRRSIALVEKSGFVREGYSRRYVKVGGRWRDHARYAILAEDWRARVAKRRSRRAAARESA